MQSKQKSASLQTDRAKLAEERVAYKKAMTEIMLAMLEAFINEALKIEITELREDREAQKENFGKLEGFRTRTAN